MLSRLVQKLRLTIGAAPKVLADQRGCSKLLAPENYG
jgi:hypothetical protein